MIQSKHSRSADGCVIHSEIQVFPSQCSIIPQRLIILFMVDIRLLWDLSSSKRETIEKADLSRSSAWRWHILLLCSLVRTVMWPPQDSKGAANYRPAMFSGNRKQQNLAENYLLEGIFSEQHSEVLSSVEYLIECYVQFWCSCQQKCRETKSKLISSGSHFPFMLFISFSCSFI